MKCGKRGKQDYEILNALYHIDGSSDELDFVSLGAWCLPEWMTLRLEMHGNKSGLPNCGQLVCTKVCILFAAC